jgi:hypothetical protein
MREKQKWEAPELREMNAADARNGTNYQHFDANYSNGGVPPQDGDGNLLIGS